MGAFSILCTVCTFLFIVYVKSKTDAKLTHDLLNDNAELLSNIKSYEIIKPYRLEGRARRHASTRISSGHLEDTTIVFPGRKKRFHLDISLNKGLFGPQYKEHYVSSDAARFAQTIPHEHCFYHGTVKGEENSDVSLSTCDGIEGVIRTDDGTFLIQPLKSGDGQVLDDHVLFNANDVNEQVASCGHDKKSLKKEIEHAHLNHLKRVQRSVLTETKYLELFIINDVTQYKKYTNGTELRAKQMVNHLDSVYRFRNIRIALVKMETWKDRNLFYVDQNASKALNNFMEYKSKNLDKDKGKHFDNVQFITGQDFLGTTVGYAPIRSICGTRSGAVVQDWNDVAAVTAGTMAHELGHNFGMKHDESNCECPDGESQCIMNAYLSKAATKFSSCSLNYLRETLNEGYAQCLFDEPKKLYGASICGNGFVEEGEECDCGTQEECDHFENKCCNATTCMLFPGAACSHGECCYNCQLKSRGALCRDASNECDLPEYCTGRHEMCPEDHHKHDGISCEKNQGYCYASVCQNLDVQCNHLFGEGVRAGDDLCFGRNTKGDNFYHCVNKTHGEFACSKEDVRCGRLHCLANKQAKLKRGQQRGHFYASWDRKTWCIVASFTWGDGVDRQYVQDGTKCGDGKMCYNSRCVPIAEAVPTSAYIKCPNNCSENGFCNNKGHCHCNPGYACPDCSRIGPDQGGSIDSGQGCMTSSKKGGVNGVNVAAAVVIPLFLLFLIGIAVIVYIKRRTIQDRLSHYKFVRRTTTRSSNAPPPRNPQTSVLHAGLISNPTPQANFAPSAMQSSNYEPEPPTQQKFPRGPQRTPPAPAPSKTGFESVALYPPSAAPVPQETVKPRPPPPVRPVIKSNLPRTPSAPPTSPPKRPKIPPSRPTPSYKSVPDIPSAEEPTRTPPVAKRPNVVPPRPKPRASPDSHWSVPEFPDDVPVPKPRNITPRPGHQSVPLFNLPDNPENADSVKPSAVKANQASRPSPPRRPKTNENQEENRVDFRAGLKPVPKPWEKL